ncbi:MAG: helix-turn-helix transcriptional regulator [Polyangiaceae bacterium]
MATDPRLTRALEAMNQRLADRWTVASLAKIAGMSRAVFARRFLAELGAPPLKYLAERRIDAAARLLLETERALADIGTAVGYESEFAFSRAFRRVVGQPPGSFRRTTRTRPTIGDRVRCAA